MLTTSTVLADLGPAAQLRAGHLPRRLSQLLAGLALYGVSMAMMIRSGLGLDPWDVFHYGVSGHLPLSFGTVVTLVGAVVLLGVDTAAAGPRPGHDRQRPCHRRDFRRHPLGAAPPLRFWLRAVLLVLGIVLNGLASAMYIGVNWGPGPRDGLMTGISRRSGLSIRSSARCRRSWLSASGLRWVARSGSAPSCTRCP